MTDYEPGPRCPTCSKRIYDTWADAQHSIRTTRLFRNGRGLKAYSAKECGSAGFHVGEGNDHAYHNRERRDKTRDAKRATWARLEEGTV